MTLPADTYRQFVECDAVLGDNADVDGGLFLAYLHRHALGMVDAGARYAVAKCPHRTRCAPADVVHAVDLAGRDTGDLGDHGVGDDRLTLGAD